MARGQRILSTITNQTLGHASHLKTECSGFEVVRVATDLLVRTDTSKQLSRPSRAPLYNLHREQLVCACLWFYYPSLRWLGKLRQAAKQDRRYYQNDKGVKKPPPAKTYALTSSQSARCDPLTGAAFFPNVQKNVPRRDLAWMDQTMHPANLVLSYISLRLSIRKVGRKQQGPG